MQLYYNCDNPLAVLASGFIRRSPVFKSVSLSEWSELGSHGPFKITFRSDWRHALIRVQYWTVERRLLVQNDGRFSLRPPRFRAVNQDGETVTDEAEYNARKAAASVTLGDAFHRAWQERDLFADEREWFSFADVPFAASDVESVTFMTNAPNIYPRRAVKARKALLQGSAPYVERAVNDHRLKVA